MKHECDIENPVRFGRCDWRCKDCGRQLMLDLYFLAIALEEFKSPYEDV